MAVPKRKKSKSKRDKRRTHQKLTAIHPTTCPQCGEATSCLPQLRVLQGPSGRRNSRRLIFYTTAKSKGIDDNDFRRDAGER